MTPQRIADGIRWRLEAAHERMPRWIHRAVEARRVSNRVARVEFNFDAERLTRSYTRAWEILLENESRDTLGDYLEFGVYYGSSLACMHHATRALGLEQVRLFGFDSFEGLPESAEQEDNQVWFPGQYKSALHKTRRFLQKAGVDDGRIELIKGWFSDTATPETATRLSITRASVIMVDCDLYSSSVDSLAFCTPLIGRQAVMYFDDWNASALADQGLGERKAFEEWLAANPAFTARELPELQYKAKGDPRAFLVTRR